ncbi:hypothetical protein [Bradyrhizobium cenepequi]|uniref:hypothetical protein n=1 Tax=Bradyrhizobium cenepequi TaxID=2821403 RepID=UPI001CE27ADE|nr:hypothetical protein [Bradyrhizobium cenepequi]MCA6110751.1 hypothetical protein [Bradyrhizobium cenepequi]
MARPIRSLLSNRKTAERQNSGVANQFVMREVDDLRGSCCRRRIALDLVLGKLPELPRHGAPACRILLFEAFSVSYVDRNDLVDGISYLRLFRKRLHGQARMVWSGCSDVRQLFERRPQVSPMLNDQGPIATVLERAVQKAVRQGIMRRKYTETVRDVDHMQATGKKHQEADFLLAHPD